MKRTIICIFAMLIAAVWIMAGCNQIASGEVYEKTYIPAHYETYTDTEMIHAGDHWISVPITKTRWYDDEYLIYIRKENDKGDFDKASYVVGKEKYDSVKIGDEISFE